MYVQWLTNHLFHYGRYVLWHSLSPPSPSLLLMPYFVIREWKCTNWLLSEHDRMCTCTYIYCLVYCLIATDTMCVGLLCFAVYKLFLGTIIAAVIVYSIAAGHVQPLALEWTTVLHLNQIYNTKFEGRLSFIIQNLRAASVLQCQVSSNLISFPPNCIMFLCIVHIGFKHQSG